MKDGLTADSIQGTRLGAAALIVFRQRMNPAPWGNPTDAGYYPTIHQRVLP